MDVVLWSTRYPEVVPQSPDQSLWSEKGDPGYDWLRQEGRQNTENAKANVRRGLVLSGVGIEGLCGRFFVWVATVCK